jgi:hypothetical protein
MKKYNQKGNLKIVDKNLNMHKKTTSCMDCISKIFKNKSKNNKTKRKSSSKYKKNILSKINKANHHQYLPLKTLPNFCKKNEIKNNIKNNIKKILAKKNNRAINSSNINNFIFSTNSTINIENNNPNINKVNIFNRQNTEYQILNTATNIMKKNIDFKLTKLTNTKGYSVKIKKFKTKLNYLIYNI